MKDKLQSLISETAEKFRLGGLDSPELEARILVTELYKNNELEDKLKVSVERRLKHEPISRILGRRGFWNFDFHLSRETLDPRPDSETIVEAVLKQPGIMILDLGTGTGCLLLSVLGERAGAMGVGVDISADAIETAQKNANEMGLAPRVIFKNVSWENFDSDPVFDIVISNPPYIPDGDIATLDPEVRDYDPVKALAGGADGLDCYRYIAIMLSRVLKPEGAAVLEIGWNQAKDVEKILAGQGYRVIEVRQDLAGNDRCIVARRI